MGVGRRDVLKAGAAGAMVLGVGACAPPPTAATVTSPTTPAPVVATTTAPVVGEVRHGPRDRAQVALTFHGQGDPGQVGRLLAVLAASGTRTTVLAVGSWLDEQPESAARVLAGGHELGNHTQNHLAITELDAGAAYAEIAACARRLRTLTGSIGAWFRPSQTPTATPLILAQAKRAGYPACLSYDVDSLDYTDPPPAQVVGTVLELARPGSIISLHFGHETTVEAMPGILAGLAGRGLRPVTASELFA
ncbi:peptidoglycan/xylan/chitin deacetylase (PgdA/CDA1 family) [Allocatelliglobosispora scoriae]|uniref:Peptidoglycan/xylan/chitin deacetylase (PgdA/CDA1 family) n=1 Tax=Allocatelliglobosispora scoriae TaxID=643052 RepID=A0A841BKD8_9ACTN|nr:polysaccharide deacetylase family protein [Allocatelliglobosispora scoriae]MBB5867222.1 peptidoglycan/xylan/chitin deacetylase (PgdA/CDA1 family) [Allocatelliglobosispora scoriae]